MSFRGQVLTALKWTLIGRICTQIVSYGITLLVMRALLPANYGLVAIASIFTGIFAVVAEIGLGSTVVQRKSLSRLQFRQIFGIVLLSNMAMVIILFIIVAPLAAWVFAEPRVQSVIQIVSLQFIPAAFAVLPSAILDRALQYRGRAFIDFASNICGAFLTLTLAYGGDGAWSLAWGTVLTASIRAAALNAIAPYRDWPIFRFAGSDGMMLFGRDVAATQFVYYFFAQADSLIIGRVLGQQLLGIYSVSMNLASMPASRISAILNQVAFPAMAKLKREGGNVTHYVLKSLRSVSFIAFPLMWGMSSVTPELVRSLLGEKWADAIPAMAVLCIVMPLRMLGPILHAALQSVGRADISFKNTCTSAAVMCVAFAVGCQFELLGVALSWLFVYPLVFLFNVSRASAHLEMKMSEFLFSLTKPALVSALMYLSVWLTRGALTLTPLVLLGVLPLVAILVYFAVSLAINREGFLEIMHMVRPTNT